MLYSCTNSNELWPETRQYAWRIYGFRPDGPLMVAIISKQLKIIVG
jgi:hypothetical protein